MIRSLNEKPRNLNKNIYIYYFHERIKKKGQSNQHVKLEDRFCSMLTKLKR
jgi:hypothetical protein